MLGDWTNGVGPGVFAHAIAAIGNGELWVSVLAIKAQFVRYVVSCQPSREVRGANYFVKNHNYLACAATRGSG